MEYKKIIDVLDNDVTQQSKLIKKNWVEITDGACGVFSTNS